MQERGRKGEREKKEGMQGRRLGVREQKREIDTKSHSQ
jgi:hypothetical protein